ncbi:MAG: ABC transporter permease, partial [Methylophilaceae bacterium]
MHLKLAWQQLFAQWRSGDLRVLLLALVVAVTAITAVSFFTNRIASHLSSQGALVLGGDMVMIADHPIPKQAIQSSRDYTLKHTQTLEFASMVIAGEKNQLAEIKALNAGFPLRGDLTVQLDGGKAAQTLQDIPKSGEVWMDARLANSLAVGLGDTIELGASKFSINGILLREPSRGGDMFSFAPRLMMNAADVEKTELIQYGSRVKYQLLVAGDAKKVQLFSQRLAPLLQRGERIEDLKTARPEIKSALDKAETYLGLAATVTLMLSVAAMLLASEPYVTRNMEIAALLRCFGASRLTIQRIMIWQTALIALMGASIGSVLGFMLQNGLAVLAGSLFFESLPTPDYQPVLIGFVVSFAVLFALMLPNFKAIKNSAVAQILRNEFTLRPIQHWFKFVSVLTVIVLLILWLAQSYPLAMAVIVGMLLICLLCSVLAYALSHLLYGFSQTTRFLNTAQWHAIKLGLAHLKRNRALTIMQVVGFSLSAMALILLMMVKNDLLNAWQASLPVDAPNRFMINIQANQAVKVQDYAESIGVANLQVFPMVRGRLIAKNNQALSADLYADERAKRLVSREFNLSMAATMQADNQLLQGEWWSAGDASKPMLSIETDIATALGIKLGDKLTYDIAGSQIHLTVTSIRKVEWDSMRANFFVVTPPHTLDGFPLSYMTAFYLPTHQENTLNALLQKFPNFTVIDVASLMQQVRGIMQKMSLAVAYVFSLCVVAGLVVLYAALVATREARIREATLLRVFGASRRQVSIAVFAEFSGIALLSSAIAVLVANGGAFYVSEYLFGLDFQWN